MKEILLSFLPSSVSLFGMLMMEKIVEEAEASQFLEKIYNIIFSVAARVVLERRCDCRCLSLFWLQTSKNTTSKVQNFLNTTVLFVKV